MYHIRWMAENLDNFMIRLGYLKAIVHVSEVIGQGRDRTLSKMQGALCRDVSAEELPWNAVLDDYRSKKPRTRGRKGVERHPSAAASKPRLELQDAYLSDPRMPSNLGAVAKDAQYELLDWASWLGLTKHGASSLLSPGILLRTLVNEDLASLSDLQVDRNPFIIRTERVFLLWLLLEKDGDFYRRFLSELIAGHGNGAFSRLNAVNQYRAALIGLQEEMKSPDNQVPLQERVVIRRAVDSVEADRVKEKRGERALHGIMRVSPRLENLVDLGFLENTSSSPAGLKLEYEYRLTDRTRGLSAFLSQSGKSSLDDALYNGYFGFIAQEAAPTATHDSEPMSILPFLIRAYKSFEREIGAKPIQQICMGAACTAINEGKMYFEISEAAEALMPLKQSSLGQHIRLSGGFTGSKPKFVIFERGLLEKV